MKIAAAIDAYLDYIAGVRALSLNTVDAYRRDLNAFQVFASESQITDLGALSVTLLTAFLQAEAVRGLSRQSLTRRGVALRRWLQYCCQAMWLDEDFSQSVELPKAARPLPKTMSVHDVEAMFRCVRIQLSEKAKHAERDYALLMVLYASGLRVSELIRLELDDLFLERGFVRVLGKGDKERVVPLGEKAHDALSAYLQVREGNEHKTKPCSRHVFLSNRGRGLTRQRCFQIVQGIARDAGLKLKVSPHVMRHAFATHLLQNGADLRSLQMMLGHADLSTTEIYTHISNTRLAQIVNTRHPLSR